MAYVNGLGYLFEIVESGCYASALYAAHASTDEIYEEIGLGRFDAPAPNTVGWLAGVLGAIGEADTEIGGFRITRLFDLVNIGEDVLPGNLAGAGALADSLVAVYSHSMDNGSLRVSGVNPVCASS